MRNFLSDVFIPNIGAAGVKVSFLDAVFFL